MLGNLLQLAGGTLGALSSRSDKRYSRRQDELNRQFAQNQFDQQMDATIQRRVKDAQSAGIHPLFALGASAGASPTMSAGATRGSQPSGSAMGDALSGLGRQLAEAQINKTMMEAEQAFAESQLANSKAARLTQDMGARGHDGASVKTFPYPEPGPDVVYGPAEYYNPEVPVSSRVGVRAGVAPGEMEVMMPDGRKVMLYDPDLGLDEIGQFKFAFQRAIHHGADALTWLRKKLKERPLMRITKQPPARKKGGGGGW